MSSHVYSIVLHRFLAFNRQNGGFPGQSRNDQMRECGCTTTRSGVYASPEVTLHVHWHVSWVRYCVHPMSAFTSYEYLLVSACLERLMRYPWPWGVQCFICRTWKCEAISVGAFTSNWQVETRWWLITWCGVRSFNQLNILSQIYFPILDVTSHVLFPALHPLHLYTLLLTGCVIYLHCLCYCILNATIYP